MSPHMLEEEDGREKTQREFLHKIIESVSDWVSRLSIQQFGVHSVSCRILVHKRDCFWRARRNHLTGGGRAKGTKKCVIHNYALSFQLYMVLYSISCFSVPSCNMFLSPSPTSPQLLT